MQSEATLVLKFTVSTDVRKSRFLPGCSEGGSGVDFAFRFVSPYKSETRYIFSQNFETEIIKKVEVSHNLLVIQPRL